MKELMTKPLRSSANPSQFCYIFNQYLSSYIPSMYYVFRVIVCSVIIVHDTKNEVFHYGFGHIY